MSKIKVVQIALSSNEDLYTEYLDDHGRVWHEVRRFRTVEPTEENDYSTGEYYFVWEQLDLPEEPES
jgi:hypothetical protein